MEWLEAASIGFLVVFFGSLFLIGELLVKSKALFAVLGVAFFGLFFSYHIPDAGSVWIVLLFVAGLALIIIDGKLLSDGTFALIGILLMSFGLAVPTPSILYGTLVVFGFLAGLCCAPLFMKVFPRRDLWNKITLRERLSTDRGYNSMNEGYKALQGKNGRALTAFRPTGTVEIEGEHYSATSGDQWIDADSDVEVVSVDGTRILIRKSENQQNNA
ncbi:NfeD family protein [Alteribacillus sp. HJP-4]|uniref:NfeD family protein n=1 Tax=Alteribacillus sp. HJP-4 TaxID=2775394 RepID=UPI0035CCCEAE